MREMLSDALGSPGKADLRVAEHLGMNDEPTALAEQIDRFWNNVEANLREGNVRLLFVADELPRELKRLIEFLNEQFTNIEVLGVELRQYVGGRLKALVPRVIGQSEAARERRARSFPSRSGAPSVRLNRETFLSKCPREARDFFIKILNEAENRGLQVRWASESFLVHKRGELLDFFRCKIGGYLEIFPPEMCRQKCIPNY